MLVPLPYLRKLSHSLMKVTWASNEIGYPKRLFGYWLLYCTVLWERGKSCWQTRRVQYYNMLHFSLLTELQKSYNMKFNILKILRKKNVNVKKLIFGDRVQYHTCFNLKRTAWPHIYPLLGEMWHSWTKFWCLTFLCKNSSLAIDIRPYINSCDVESMWPSWYLVHTILTSTFSKTLGWKCHKVIHLNNNARREQYKLYGLRQLGSVVLQM